MRVAHILRKCDPSAWGGTEAAMQRMFGGLGAQGIESVIYCPHLDQPVDDPLRKAGHRVERFKAFVPVIGMPPDRKRQLASVGGNLMSFGLVHALWREPGIQVIHSHTLGRLGGIGLTVAKRRRIPFVVTIHGGALDLPEPLQQALNSRSETGWEWGRFFGWIFQARRLFADAQAIIACNQKEAGLLRERYPDKRVVVQRHGVLLDRFAEDQRQVALRAFPQLRQRRIVLCLGRIDPVKNQLWLIRQAPELFRQNPGAVLVLAGPCTHEAYGKEVEAAIAGLGPQDQVILTGGFAPDDPCLIGLLQAAELLVLPSVSETFGLVIIEAWAAGTPVLCSRTSGAAALVQHNENGWLFDLSDPLKFHGLANFVLRNPEHARATAQRGRALVESDFSVDTVARQLRSVYEEVCGEVACTA